MPIQGVSNQIFELLFSPDKKVQNFIDSLKPGDILNGKVIDIFNDENKALINFKGYNLITQLPQNINIQKGDIINVIVYNINDKIYMKLNNLNINNNQTSLSLKNYNAASTDILSTLNSLKIPVNEHNLFVAQNLIKYQLPVNKENVNTINNALINFMQKKGIDFRIFNIQNFSVANEIILANILKLNTDINEIYNIINKDNIINQNQFNDFKNLLKISEKLLNFTNISAELNKWSQGQRLNILDDTLYVNFDNINQNNIINIISLLEKSGFNINKINKNELLSAKSEVIIQLNNNVSLFLNNNSISIKFENLINNLKEIVMFFNKSRNKQIVTNFNEIISNLRNMTLTKQILSNLNPKLYNLKNIFDEINKNVFQPNNTKINDNIKHIVLLLDSFKNELQNIESNNIIIQNDFNRIFKSLNKTIDTLSCINFENKIIPRDFINIQNTLKQFITDVNNILNFKNVVKNKINIQTPSIINMNIESIIESIVFLKSRDINTDNEKFIDIMSKYFANDMKLSNNIEKLNLIIDDLFKILNNEKIPLNEFKKSIDIINDIKNTLNEISIKPDNNNLQPEILLNQLKDFIEKSGLNIENNIKNLLLKNLEESQKPTIHALQNNLKSLLIKLSDEIDIINVNNFNNNIKESLILLKEVSKDILNVLNAIQLINQKQSAIDLIYTQIPLFLDTKFFNGELQVWYRKDGIKQELGKLTPINMLFILNTSNFGQVKLHITIFKNQIDCIIITQNEKFKHILTRGKNEFVNKLHEMNYKVNTFNINLENELVDTNDDQSSNQYIKLTNINLKA